MAVMKWSPREFWRSTPYDCLLAAGGMAQMNKGGKRQMTDTEVDHIKELMAKDKLKNGNG